MSVVSRVRLFASSLIKKVPFLKTIPALGALGLLVLAAAGLTVHTVITQRSAEQQQRQADRAQGIDEQLTDAKAKQQVAAGQQPAAADEPAAAAGEPVAAAPKSEPRKYATSSDPRSTAYATTPPAPHPSSFETVITRNGQVAPGTLISYNATKGEKAYYGGDLLLSTYSVTLSRSGTQSAARPAITITVPDGHEVLLPTKPWNDRSPLWISIDSTKYKSVGTSFEMNVDGTPPNGRYMLHIHTSRTAQTADAWYYDAFLTVNVVD